MAKEKSFRELLVDELQDPAFAAAYLNEHYGYHGPKRKELLLEAIKNIVEAQGFTKLSKASGISRRALYKAFSKNGNPTVETLLALLDAIGVSIRFDTDRKKAKKRAA